MQNLAEKPKTPVTMLQELASKRFLIPTYTYIYDTVYFKCIVKCFELESEGMGSTKKVAKHSAAYNLLKLINFDDNLINTSVIKPLKVCNSRVNNYVGVLQEYSVANKVGFPVYEKLGVVVDVGCTPMYITKCTVGYYSAIGTGMTKKSAKQKAASNVFNYFKLEGGEVLERSHSSGSISSTYDKNKEPDKDVAKEMTAKLNNCEPNNEYIIYDFQFNEFNKHLVLTSRQQSNDLNSLDSDDESF